VDQTNFKNMARYSEPRTSDQGDEIDLLQLLATLWRGKLWIVLTTVSGIILGGYYLYGVAVPMYTARTAIALEQQKEQVVDLQSVMSGISGDQSTINTQVELLRSRSLISKLVQSLDLEADPEFNPTLEEMSPISVGALKSWVKDKLGLSSTETQLSASSITDMTVDAVLKSISVSNVRQSYVFQVSAVSTSPQKSAAMANRLAELYIQDQLDVKFNATEQAVTWLTNRVSELKDQLETSEAQVKAFDSGTDLINPETLMSLNRQLKEQRDRANAARVDALKSVAFVNALKRAGAGGSDEDMAAAASDRTLSQTLEMVRAGTVPHDAFETQFAAIQNRAQIDADRARSQVKALEASTKEFESQINAQSKDLLTLQQLQREADASRSIYEYFLGRLKETSVQTGIQHADSRVISSAVVPLGATSPRKSLVLAMAAILGLFVGSGGVLLREMMNTTIRTTEDLEAVSGLTVFGSMPVIPARTRKSAIDYILSHPTSQAAEAVRNTRTSIMLSNIDNPPKIIMVTSSVPGEGKTTQSLMLAINMAALGKKVLLIEGDLRRRVLAEYLNIKPEHGLVSVIAGECEFTEAVYHDEHLGIDVLIAEHPRISAADFYASAKFAAFLREMRNDYDLVVVDTPPVLVVPDARVIGQFVEAIVLVVKWDSTSRQQVRDALSAFESYNQKVAGLVMSQVNTRQLKRYGYGDGYGAAYSGYYDT